MKIRKPTLSTPPTHKFIFTKKNIITGSTISQAKNNDNDLLKLYIILINLFTFVQAAQCLVSSIDCIKKKNVSSIELRFKLPCNQLILGLKHQHKQLSCTSCVQNSTASQILQRLFQPQSHQTFYLCVRISSSTNLNDILQDLITTLIPIN